MQKKIHNLFLVFFSVDSIGILRFGKKWNLEPQQCLWEQIYGIILLYYSHEDIRDLSTIPMYYLLEPEEQTISHILSHHTFK